MTPDKIKTGLDLFQTHPNTHAHTHTTLTPSTDKEMTMLSTSRLALRNRPTVIVNAVVGRRYGGHGAARLVSFSRAKTSSSTSSSFQTYTSASLVLAATLLCTADNINRDTINYNNSTAVAQCSAAPLGAEPVMLSPTKEEATGILFPSLCNGMSLAGCGVRVKWGFVKVSFVLLFGFYLYARYKTS